LENLPADRYGLRNRASLRPSNREHVTDARAANDFANDCGRSIDRFRIVRANRAVKDLAFVRESSAMAWPDF
jgi:hypothetical protein